MLLKDTNSLLRATHVTSLGDKLCASFNQRLALLAGNLILRRARQCHINLADIRPRPCTLDVFDLALVTVRIGKLCQLLSLHFQIGNVRNLVGADAFLAFGNDGAFAVGEGDDCGAKFDGFQGSILGDVPRTRYGDAFAFKCLFAAGCILDHVIDVLYDISGGLELGGGSRT